MNKYVLKNIWSFVYFTQVMERTHVPPLSTKPLSILCVLFPIRPPIVTGILVSTLSWYVNGGSYYLSKYGVTPEEKYALICDTMTRHVNGWSVKPLTCGLLQLSSLYY
jgi:hypothetical protein